MAAVIAPIRFQSAEELFQAAARLLEEHFRYRQPDGKPHAVMLAGGQTPVPIYRRVAAHPFAAAPGLRVFLSDERMVPPDHPDSNFARCAPLFPALGLGDDRVLRVPTDLPLDQAADRYHDALSDLLGQGALLTLGLLGLGADGHTASLFSRDDALRTSGRLAIPVRRPQPPHRVSVTPALIRRIERVVFLAAGAEKRNVVDVLLRDPTSVPAGLAVRNVARVELWADRSALAA